MLPVSIKITGLFGIVAGALMLTGCGSTKPTAQQPTAQPEQVAQQNSNYKTYSADAVKLAASQGKKTAVFFHGANCGSCAKLDANIKANQASIPNDVVVFNADWDSNQALAKQYGVDKYHTVSFLGGGAPKNVKGLFELKDIVAEFDKPAPKKAVEGYKTYSASKVKLAQSEGKKTAIFFHGRNCGSCAKLDADITANGASIPKNTVVFKADRDANQKLAKELGVDKYHTVSYLGDEGNARNVKGLFELKDVVAEFSKPIPAAKKSGGYQAYSASALKLAQAEGKKTAVFFHGANCGSCAKLDANIKENEASIPSDVVVFNADWDKNQDLAKEYGVAKYHTVSYLGEGAPKNVKGLFELKDVIAEFDTPIAGGNGGYQAYSASAVKLAQAEGKKTAVFFHGANCGSCAKLDANIKENEASIPSDVVVFNADWDKNQDLAKEYGVAKYHTVSYLGEGAPKNVKGLFELKDLIAEFDSPIAGGNGGYQAYSASAVKLAQAEGKKTAIFFHSKTCGSCGKLDANISENVASIPGDVAIFKADRDQNQDLATELGVDKYHTVSFLGNGTPKNVKGLFELSELTTNFN